MIILTKLFLNSKLDLIWISKFVKQLFRIQIKKDRKVSLWNQVKSRMEACYSELALTEYSTVVTRVWRLLWRLGGCGAQPVELRSKSSQWGQILYEVACKFFQYFPYQYLLDFSSTHELKLVSKFEINPMTRKLIGAILRFRFSFPPPTMYENNFQILFLYIVVGGNWKGKTKSKNRSN